MNVGSFSQGNFENVTQYVKKIKDNIIKKYSRKTKYPSNEYIFIVVKLPSNLFSDNESLIDILYGDTYHVLDEVTNKISPKRKNNGLFRENFYEKLLGVALIKSFNNRTRNIVQSNPFSQHKLSDEVKEIIELL